MMAAENYIAKLNEHAQKSRYNVTYEDVEVVGPDHIKTFTLRAVVNGKAYPEGVGKNKKEAKQNAAENALKGLLRELGDTKENGADTAQMSAASVQTSISRTNYVSWLNEYGQKHRLTVKAVESSTLGPYNTATCSFLVGEKKYPLATGKTKREAKEEAAKIAYHEICVNKTAGTVNETANTGPSSQQEVVRNDLSEISDNIQSLSVETEEDGVIETNFIGIINHYCQKTNRAHRFIEERRCGPPHRPQFFYKLVIDDKDYPVGEGKNIKEAKQNAAHLAYSALQEQSDWDSKVSFRSAKSEDGVCPSIPPSTLESLNATPKGMRTTTTSNSIVFTNTSYPQAPIQSPDLKPKRKIAANFSNTPGKEDVKRSDLEGKPKKGSQTSGSKPRTQAVVSRFKSDYDSMEHLGKGAFGRVFKAKQKLVDTFYAVKIVRCKEKALREVSALSDLQHRNIIRYYTCWLEDSEYQPDGSVDSSNTSQGSDSAPVKYLYIQMELCDPKTLRLWIDERNTQNPKKSLRDFRRREDSLNIAQQLVSGVEYIHSRMLIHRDLKPANILFGQNGEVKIGDFGLVTNENDDDAENLLERTVYKGTPSYMAPEQKNKKTYDRKVDIFALGLIYFELLWNIFTYHERKAIWEDARSQKLPQGFSANFIQENRVIKMMLCLQPADRPEASKLKTELEEVARALYEQKNIQQERNTV